MLLNAVKFISIDFKEVLFYAYAIMYSLICVCISLVGVSFVLSNYAHKLLWRDKVSNCCYTVQSTLYIKSLECISNNVK